MALQKIASVFLIVAMLLATALFTLAPVQAQGESKLFPETGKTVGGRFLGYWQSHGALSQQGFPITDELQETSATDGNIYTVQFFERAVFEHHPENQAPNDILLSLLGAFLYKQNYPQGAPGQAPNSEANKRLFAETGKTVGGLFLDYWQSHGGLPQQGFPISEEFNEVSALNGKTYKVQYFERAVFEYHPENQAPNNVLLSQVGTFRYRAKYGALSNQLTGVGNLTTKPFALKAGLTVLQGVRSATDGYYYIDLYDTAGNQLATTSAGSGPSDMSSAVKIPADGMYVLQVQADDAWTVNTWHPSASYSQPPARQSWSGNRWQATPLFSLKAGPAVFHAVSAKNQEAISIVLLDQTGENIDSIVGSTGATDETVTINIPADGVYLIQVVADAAWTVDVQQ